MRSHRFGGFSLGPNSNSNFELVRWTILSVTRYYKFIILYLKNSQLQNLKNLKSHFSDTSKEERDF